MFKFSLKVEVFIIMNKIIKSFFTFIFCLLTVSPLLGMNGENNAFITAKEFLRQIREVEDDVLLPFILEWEREQELVNEINQQIIIDEIWSNFGAQRILPEFGIGNFNLKLNDALRLYTSENVSQHNVNTIVNSINSYKRGNVLDLSGLSINSEQLNILIPYIKYLITYIGLRRLNLSNNQITYLPQTFGKLNGLFSLSLSGNRLYYFNARFRYSGQRLPNEDSLECLSKITTLNALDLSNNSLKYIPWQLNKLSNLFLLDLSGNRKMYILHKSFFRLENLYCLILRGTNFGKLMRARILIRMRKLNMFF